MFNQSSSSDGFVVLNTAIKPVWGLGSVAILSYLTAMAGGVPDWDQTGKQELPDVTTTQGQGSYGQDGCAGTDMPAARRAEMQAECGQTLLRRIRQKQDGGKWHF